MSGHHNKVGRLILRRQLQAAGGMLARFGDDLRASRKSDGWSPRAVVNEHRNALAQVVEELEPIIAERLKAEITYDREVEAVKADAAGGRGVFASAPVSPEVEAFKAEVRNAIEGAPDSESARRRVAMLVAKSQVKRILGGVR